MNNFAELALAKHAGAGTLGGAGSSYTLDFGTLVQGTAGLDADLAILNVAIGPADVLNGSFDLGQGAAFTLSNFSPFSGIAAGSSQTGFEVAFDSSTLGSFTRTIVISATGSNAEFLGALPNTVLVLQGSVVAVPEPGTYALMGGGLLALWLMRRRGLQARRAA